MVIQHSLSGLFLPQTPAQTFGILCATAFVLSGRKDIDAWEEEAFERYTGTKDEKNKEQFKKALRFELKRLALRKKNLDKQKRAKEKMRKEKEEREKKKK